MADIEFINELKKEGYHLGHLFISLMTRNPDELNQIDAATGEKEKNASVLYRSVRLAKCLRRFGLKPGDVMALGGRNHLDLHIPHYAALMNGLPLVGVDPNFKYDEIYGLLKLTLPKIAFCQFESQDDFQRAAAELNLDMKIVTFGEGECTMAKFMDLFDEDGSLEGFEPASFDLDKMYVWLISTGGTMGASKIAAFLHQTWLEKALHYWYMVKKYKKGNTSKWSDNLALNIAPVHWVSAFFCPIGMPLQGQCKLQTSARLTTDHLIDVINEFKPATLFMGPSHMTSILNHEKKCDFSNTRVITLTGGQVYKDILVRLKKQVNENTAVYVAYGQTESLGPVLQPLPIGPLGHCGKPMPVVQLRLVDAETGKEVTEPNTSGELWVKGLRFKEYYKNPEETAKAITEDGWFKTGDIFYRDADDYYFFVERLKVLIKYRNYHIVPVELEETIRTHPDVFDVGVTSIPHPEDGEHPVAFVVKRPGSDVTADDIKKLVLEKLSANKQLRGGVVFVDELPLTSPGKLARMKLRKMAAEAHRE